MIKADITQQEHFCQRVLRQQTARSSWIATIMQHWVLGMFFWCWLIAGLELSIKI
jgi:hypothetical protein